MALTDRYVSSSASGGSGTLGDPWDIVTASDNSAAGDRVNVKADGTYTLAAELIIDIGASTTLPVHWRGYGTTIGDGTKPTIDCIGSHRVRVGLNTTGQIIFESFSITGSNAFNAVFQSIDNGGALIIDCDMENTDTNSTDDGNLYQAVSLTDSTVINCYFKNNATNPDSRVGAITQGQMFNCVVEGPVSGLRSDIGFGDYTMSDIIFIGNGTSGSFGMFITGIENGGILSYKNLTFHNFESGISFDTGDADNIRAHSIINCLFSSCTFGIKNDSTKDTSIHVISPAFYGVAYEHDFGEQVIFNSTTLTDDPFTNAAGNDFSLNDSPSGGDLLRKSGYGTTDMGDGVNKNFVDIGGSQVEVDGDTSDYAENKILDYVLRDDTDWAPATVYLGLFSESPSDDVSGSELSSPTDANYARQSITFSASASGTISNSAIVNFPTASNTWSAISHFGLFDASSGGNLLFYGKFTSSTTIGNFEKFRVQSGNLTIRMD